MAGSKLLGLLSFVHTSRVKIFGASAAEVRSCQRSEAASAFEFANTSANSGRTWRVWGCSSPMHNGDAQFFYNKRASREPISTCHLLDG